MDGMTEMRLDGITIHGSLTIHEPHDPVGLGLPAGIASTLPRTTIEGHGFFTWINTPHYDFEAPMQAGTPLPLVVIRSDDAQAEGVAGKAVLTDLNHTVRDREHEPGKWITEGRTDLTLRLVALEYAELDLAAGKRLEGK